MNLGDIRQEARDIVDEQTVTTSGKYSSVWWLRLINRTKDILADRTGFNLTLQAVTVNAYTQFSALPTSLCWGIVGAWWGNTRLDGSDAFSYEDDHSGWMFGSPWPNQPANDSIQVISNAIITATATHASPTDTFRTSNTHGLTLNAQVKFDTSNGNITSGTTYYVIPVADTLFQVSATESGTAVVLANHTNHYQMVLTADDTTQVITVYGTTYGTDIVVREDIVLNGTTAVTSSKTDWGKIFYAELDDDCEGVITIRETSAGAIITTIVAGDTTAGNLPSFDDPAEFAIVHPNFYWQPTPSTSGVVYVLAGYIPANLASDGDTVTGLPARFGHTIADGAAALSQGADLYDSPQQQRLVAGLQDWNSGIIELNQYLDSINHDRQQAMRIEVSR